MEEAGLYLMATLTQPFPTLGQFCLQGTFATSGDICGCHRGGAPVIEWVGPGMLLHIP